MGGLTSSGSEINTEKHSDAIDRNEKFLVKNDSTLSFKTHTELGNKFNQSPKDNIVSAIFREDDEAIKKLIKNGLSKVSLEQAYYFGLRNSNIELIQLCVEVGVCFNKKYPYYGELLSSLDIASNEGNLIIVKFLYEQGALPTEDIPVHENLKPFIRKKFYKNDVNLCGDEVCKNFELDLE